MALASLVSFQEQNQKQKPW